MKKMVLVLLQVLLVLGLVVSADAVEKKSGTRGKAAAYEGCGCSEPQPHMPMFGKLGLDEKQREAVRAIRLQTKKDMARKRADVEVARIELQEILSKDPVDMAAAEAAVKKIEGMKAEMKMAHIRTMEEIKSNLNPEQKEKFREMTRLFFMKKRGRHGESRMHEGMGPG